jgi:hypothetical protein
VAAEFRLLILSRLNPNGATRFRAALFLIRKFLARLEQAVLNAYLGETEEFYQYLDSTLEQ